MGFDSSPPRHWRDGQIKQLSVYGSVVQLVRMLACHARGHGFESRRSRQYGPVAQLGEHLPCKQEVRGSSPLRSTRNSFQACSLGLVPLIMKMHE